MLFGQAGISGCGLACHSSSNSAAQVWLVMLALHGALEVCLLLHIDAQQPTALAVGRPESEPSQGSQTWLLPSHTPLADLLVHMWQQ